MQAASVLIIGAAVVAVSVLVAVYIAWRLSPAAGGGARYDVTRGAKVVLGEAEPLVLASKDVPAVGVGDEYSFAFWIHVPSFNPREGTLITPVLHRSRFPGTTRPKPDVEAVFKMRIPALEGRLRSGMAMRDAIRDTLSSGEVTAADMVRAMEGVFKDAAMSSPLVFVDNGVNRLVVLAQSSRGMQFPPLVALKQWAEASGTGDELDFFRALGWVAARIDYLPLQRWVHVAAAVHKSKLMLYLDGAPYTSESLHQLPAARDKQAQARLRFGGARGDLRVGGVVDEVSTPSAAGSTVRKVRWFDHALSRAAVAAEYAEGPATAKQAWLGRLGLGGGWDLRSPVYRRAA